MRIIGGEFRGRAIKMPSAPGRVRPTQDRVREAVFNIIRMSVPGSRVLDLYTGSGAFGLEALSRGAESAVFVDDNTICVKTVKANLALFGEKAKAARVLKKDALKALGDFGKEGLKFDIIFLDPPYYLDLAKNTLIKIGACDILSKRGFAVSEHSARGILPDNISNLIVFTRKKYGDTVISLYRKVTRPAA